MTTTTTTTVVPTTKRQPTHELFDVQEREGQRAFWNKVGAAFENKDQSHSLLIYQPGLPTPKRLQLRKIDRERRPLGEGADPKKSPTHELFLVVEIEGAQNDWKRVGVGFTNKDDSLSLVIDDGNRDGPKARFQLRVRREQQSGRRPDSADGSDRADGANSSDAADGAPGAERAASTGAREAQETKPKSTIVRKAPKQAA